MAPDGLPDSATSSREVIQKGTGGRGGGVERGPLWTTADSARNNGYDDKRRPQSVADVCRRRSARGTA